MFAFQAPFYAYCNSDSRYGTIPILMATTAGDSHAAGLVGPRIWGTRGTLLIAFVQLPGGGAPVATTDRLVPV